VSRPGSRRDHQKFCDTEGWQAVRNARGQGVGHHITYELALLDGQILRTRISRPANTERYGPALWAAILGPQQFDVTEDEFWLCVDKGVTPHRPGEVAALPREALPADLVYQLLHKVKLTEPEVAALTRQQAIDLMTEYWSKPQP
jgi:hypothetical protein